jgi:hypothetical protein
VNTPVKEADMGSLERALDRARRACVELAIRRRAQDIYGNGRSAIEPEFRAIRA